MSKYVKTFKDNDKLISLCIDDEKLLEKYKTMWNKMENLKILNGMLYQFMVIVI